MRTDKEYLLDILQYAENIEEFVSGMDFETFCEDKRTHLAVIRCFEVIGESIKQLNPSVTALKPEIPWSDFAGFRDVLIHAYHRVNMLIVWNTIYRDLPGLKKATQDLLATIPPSGG